MEKVRKKENPENLKKRVAKFRSKANFDRIEISNISHLLKLEFLNLPGNTYSEKLKVVIEAWKELNRKTELAKFTISGPITSNSIPSRIPRYEEPNYEIQPKNKSGPLFKGKINTPSLSPPLFTRQKKR